MGQGVVRSIMRRRIALRRCYFLTCRFNQWVELDSSFKEGLVWGKIWDIAYLYMRDWFQVHVIVLDVFKLLIECIPELERD